MSAFKRPSVLMKPIMIALFTAFILPAALAQDYRYGLYLSPMISWFGTDVDNVSNKGVRAGFGANITAERHLTDNWYFTSGLGFSSVSGRLVNSTSSFFRFPNHTSTIPEGEPVIYKLQYLSIPVGAKIKTTETGYLVYFAEFGLDPKVAVSKRVDIPSIGVDGERASGEIKSLNAGYHLIGGAEYSIDGNASLVLGLGYESNIFDTTRDYEANEKDRSTQKMFRFILGINF
ncbi:MAG TPA: porin family protein [Bacteroidales bacterium]|jgi:hypothetical protein|nr:PorT family protein [Bacteroidales bacterium]MDI9552746.1 porin family protein [Bacteroidota bacterium]MZP65198.1 outer membrane beta-barrel protein [Bacteroidales bacterium]NLK55595.1 PorT family protein [Bacteroidales bacterium]HNY53111.1 porin family protein [Bacteroidales bacterium]